MKLFVFTLTLLFCSTIPIAAQNSANKEAAVKEVANLSAQVGRLYTVNYAEALKLARNAVELVTKENLFDTEVGLVAVANLGTIYFQSFNVKDAAPLYQKFVDSAAQTQLKEKRTYLKVLENLANCYVRLKDERAEQTHAAALAAFENVYGEESLEASLILEKTAEFYANAEQYEKADEFYRRTFELRNKILPPVSEQRLTALDNYSCFAGQSTLPKSLRQKAEDYVKTKLKEDAAIINDKDLKIGEADFSPVVLSFAGKHSEPSVNIRLIIDENGNVTQAKAFCGNLLMRTEAEKAAKKSKFKPLLNADGKAVRSTSTILYTYRR